MLILKSSCLYDWMNVMVVWRKIQTSQDPNFVTGELLTPTAGEDDTFTRQTGRGPTMKLSFTATRVENLPVTVGWVKGQDDIEVLQDRLYESCGEEVILFW